MLIKTGDYVEVKKGVHDDRMPKGRRDGLVVEVIGQDGRHRCPDQVLVMFSNSVFLKFHETQIRVIQNESR